MLPSIIEPMLAGCAAEPFDSKDHLFELKWDGIRCVAFIDNKRLRLQSRMLLDLTEQIGDVAVPHLGTRAAAGAIGLEVPAIGGLMQPRALPPDVPSTRQRGEDRRTSYAAPSRGSAPAEAHGQPIAGPQLSVCRPFRPPARPWRRPQ